MRRGSRFAPGVSGNPAGKPSILFRINWSFLLAAAAAGRVTPGEAEKLARLTGEYLRAVELGEIEERLKRLEEKQDA